MTAKTAEHDTVMGALRSAQDVIEGILNATQALLTSLTYPDSSTVMGAGSSPAESEAKLLLLPTRSAEKLAKELASSAKERLTLDRTAKKALRDLTTEWLGARVIPMINETVDKRNEAAWQTVEQTKSETLQLVNDAKQQVNKMHGFMASVEAELLKLQSDGAMTAVRIAAIEKHQAVKIHVEELAGKYAKAIAYRTKVGNFGDLIPEDVESAVVNEATIKALSEAPHARALKTIDETIETIKKDLVGVVDNTMLTVTKEKAARVITSKPTMPKNLLQATRDVNKDFDVYKHFKDAVKSYLIGRGQEYFLICHDVVRVLDDYNPKLGLHWSADPGDINEASHSMYIEQDERLAEVLRMALAVVGVDEVQLNKQINVGVTKSSKIQGNSKSGVKIVELIVSQIHAHGMAYNQQLQRKLRDACVKFKSDMCPTTCDPVLDILTEMAEAAVPAFWYNSGLIIYTACTMKCPQFFQQRLSKWEHGGADPNDCREAIEEMIAEIKVGYDNMVQAVGNGNVNHKAVRAAMARKMPSDAEDSEEESTDELEQEKALKRKALKALKAEKQKNDKLSTTNQNQQSQLSKEQARVAKLKKQSLEAKKANARTKSGSGKGVCQVENCNEAIPSYAPPNSKCCMLHFIEVRDKKKEFKSKTGGKIFMSEAERNELAKKKQERVNNGTQGKSHIHKAKSNSKESNKLKRKRESRQGKGLMAHGQHEKEFNGGKDAGMDMEETSDDDHQHEEEFDDDDLNQIDEGLPDHYTTPRDDGDLRERDAHMFMAKGAKKSVSPTKKKAKKESNKSGLTMFDIMDDDWTDELDEELAGSRTVTFRQPKQPKHSRKGSK